MRGQRKLPAQRSRSRVARLTCIPNHRFLIWHAGDGHLQPVKFDVARFAVCDEEGLVAPCAVSQRLGSVVLARALDFVVAATCLELLLTQTTPPSRDELNQSTHQHATPCRVSRKAGPEFVSNVVGGWIRWFLKDVVRTLGASGTRCVAIH